MIPVGIIGIGAVSKHYLAAIEKSQDLSLCGVYDACPDAISAARLAKNIAVYQSATELICHSEMIIICTPTVSHYDYLKEVLEAETPHVVCEKPICSTVGQSQVIRDLAGSSISWITVSYNLRFLPAVKRIRELVEGDRVCNLSLSLIYERVADFKPGWREDPSHCRMGGAAGDLGCHLLDLVEYLSGSRVSLNKDSVIFGYDKYGVPGKINDGYFEAYGAIASGGNFKLIASKVGAHLDRGFTLRINTSAKTLVYSSKNSEVLVCEDRRGNSECIFIGSECRGPEDKIMAGWTSSFGEILRSNLAKSIESVDVSTACNNLDEIQRVM